MCFTSTTKSMEFSFLFDQKNQRNPLEQWAIHWTSGFPWGFFCTEHVVELLVWNRCLKRWVFRRPAKKDVKFENMKLPKSESTKSATVEKVSRQVPSSNFLLRCMDSVFARLSWNKKNMFVHVFLQSDMLPRIFCTSPVLMTVIVFFGSRRLVVEKRDQKLEQWAKQTRIVFGMSLRMNPWTQILAHWGRFSSRWFLETSSELGKGGPTNVQQRIY